MHRKGKAVIQRLKSIIRAICNSVSFTSNNEKRTRKHITGPISLPIPIIHAADTDSTGTTERALRITNNARFQALRHTEVYLPGHVWDAMNPTERFASVADLCAHVGDQLPTQVVKLIARDVLRELINVHRTRERGHHKITQNTILLSPTDLRALIAQLRAETQTSLRPSELAIGTGAFNQDGGAASPEASAVFRLTDPDSQNRIEYIEDQATVPPEALLGAPCGTSGDMWTLGCILFELLTGEALFDPAFQTLELGISQAESHIIQMIELFGAIPVDVIQSGAFSSQWFKEDGALRIETSYYPATLESLLERHIEKSEVLGATDFLEALLRIHPEDRAQPEEVIDHYWFTAK